MKQQLPRECPGCEQRFHDIIVYKGLEYARYTFLSDFHGADSARASPQLLCLTVSRLSGQVHCPCSVPKVANLTTRA
jgi:hypothetical protein